MYYYVPDVTSPDSYSPDQIAVGQLGGMPVAFPAERWPHCSACEGAMSFIAQFNHHPQAVDLGASGRTLYIFMCQQDPGMCEDWYADGGANACLLLDHHEQQTDTVYTIDAPLQGDTVPIHAWLRRESQLTPQEAHILAHQDYPESMSKEELSALWKKKISGNTHMGGIPDWIQGADEGYRPGWEFVGQIESGLKYLKQDDRRDITDPHHVDKAASYKSDKFNFGGGGAAYIFAERANTHIGEHIAEHIAERPIFHFFWQCG